MLLAGFYIPSATSHLQSQGKAPWGRVCTIGKVMGMEEYLEKFLFWMKFVLLLFLCNGHVFNFFSALAYIRSLCSYAFLFSASDSGWYASGRNLCWRKRCSTRPRVAAKETRDGTTSSLQFNRGIPLGYYPTNYYPIRCNRVSKSHSTRLTKDVAETSRFMNDHR